MSETNEEWNKFLEVVKRSRVFNNIVERYALNTKSVLDIGCSEGHHLALFGEGSVGITIIDEHIEIGRAQGLTILSKNVEDPEFAMDKTFDVIWANNLFEHLNSPHPFLMRMRECLAEDGILILGVPLIPYMSFLTRFRKFRGAFAHSHVNFFSRRTLIETVRAGGWIVEEAQLFYFKNTFLNLFLNPIAPHMYVIARPNKEFSYGEKRRKSLRGYKDYVESD